MKSAYEELDFSYDSARRKNDGQVRLFESHSKHACRCGGHKDCSTLSKSSQIRAKSRNMAAGQKKNISSSSKDSSSTTRIGGQLNATLALEPAHK